MTRPDPKDPARYFDPRTTSDIKAATRAYADRWLGQAQTRLDEARVRSEQLRERLVAASYEATSRDQFATVTVGPTGNLLNVSVSDRARNVSPVQISQAVMSAYRLAAKQAVAANTAMVREAAGDEAAEQLQSLMPQLDEDEESPR